MKLLGKAYFAPEKRGAYVDVLMARCDEELCAAWEEDDKGCEDDFQPRAFSVTMPHKDGMLKYGSLVFNWNDCEIPIVVHEAVHAAEAYAFYYLKSKQYKKLTRKEKIEVRSELMPCLVESLVSQAWVLISNEKNTKL